MAARDFVFENSKIIGFLGSMVRKLSTLSDVGSPILSGKNLNTFPLMTLGYTFSSYLNCGTMFVG